MRVLFISAVYLLTFSATAYAQVVPNAGAIQPRVPGVYQRLAHPGEATVPVIVMGLGGQGLYEVGESVEIDELLVLAGGTSLNPREAKITIRVYRELDGQRMAIYEEPLERMLIDQAAYPTLQPGDMLYVESRQRRQFAWRDVLTILSSASTLILLYYRLSGLR